MEQCAEYFLLRRLLGRAEHQVEAEKTGARFKYVDGLWEAAGIDKENIRCRLADTPRHVHRLGRRRRFVEQRSVGQFQAGQVDNHLLIVEQRLQASLRNLGLVGRVRRVPARVFQHIAQDHLGRQRVGVTHADQRFVHAVFVGHCLQHGQRLVLGPCVGQ